MRADDQPIEIVRPLERALLVRLALADGAAVLDQALARALWDEEDPPRLAARLRVIASRLRHNLGEHATALTRTPAGFALDAKVVDLAAARSATPDAFGDPQAIHQTTRSALTLWRGDSLADLRTIPYFATEGARLDALRLELQIAWIESGLAIGTPDVRGDLERLNRLHPLNEQLARLSALDLYRTGRQAEALNRFARLRQALTDELQATPLPATTQLELQLLRQDPELLRRSAPRTSAATSAPTAQTPFVGRDLERTRLLEQLSAAALVTVVGGPGVGKTRLAVEIAAALRSAGRSVAWLDLAPLRASDDLAAALATSLGIEAENEPLVKCARFLAGSLLVLDNAEHVVDQVADLLRSLRDRGITFLVTSQLPIRLEDEQVHQLGPLSLHDAIALFCVRSGTARSPAAEAICTAVDCFPLGIELAAGLTRTLTVDQIAARIDDRLRLLIGGRRAGGNRHTSLLAALDWSHELLDQPARTVFRRLAVFADGCTLEAAEKVVAGNGLDEVELVALLDELVDRCLLTVANGRFHQLESIHAYAWRQLELAGDEEPVRRRHLAWSVEQVTGLDQYGGSEHARTVRRFDQEMANLRAAVRWALGPGSDPAAAIAIAAPSRWHWWNHRLTDETLDWLRRALAALPSDAIRSRAEGTLALAFMTHNKSELGATADHLHQALADFEELADETGAIWALIGLGWSALALDDPAAAIEYGRQSSGRSLQAGDPDGQAAGLNTIGLALRSLDRYEEAVGYFTEALDCWRSTGAQHSAAVALSNLAIVARRLGRYAESRRLCLESLQQFQHFDLVDNQLDIVDCWAQLEAAEGRPAEALRFLTVAVRQRELRAAPVFVSDELANRDTSLAAVRSTLGDGAAAIEAAALRIPLGVVVEEILGSG